MTTLLNWSSCGGQNEDRTLLQRSQGRVSTRKHQYTTAIATMWTESSWAFPDSYTAGSCARAIADNGETKRLIAPPSRWVSAQLSYYTFVSLHDSDHGGVVRIFVALSCELWSFFIYITSSGNRTPGSRFYSDLLDTSVCIHQLVLKRLSKR